MRKKLTLFSGTSSAFSASTWNVTSSTEPVLVKLDGWDEVPDIIRNSTPILWSNTTAVSKDAKYGPRTITVTINIMGNATQRFNVQQSVKAMLSDLNALRTFHLYTYADTGTELQRETLRCLFASGGYEWEEINGSATLTLTMIAPNPLKAVTRNGIDRGEQI